ncbi:Ankyrin repeat domain-containing 63 [Labeo rohita]|uniref:Ankyrin repeat domain-containing 63 n=1 Tax=Labeo rohita TaxID=84645 RepID=A0A498LTT2_LABRO|nr:serine/threonine-protein phosphatase 6 regulatory ankyrin repeat subunit B-like [Labeo rohita]RXN11858.1 Ankyrin repeat domain-containing 63 [Labeo rohita]
MLKLSDRCGSKTDTKILLDAISNDKIHLARFILDALDGRIVNSKTEGAQTPLISAVFLQDSPARCRFVNLLLQRGASVNHPDESGRTALSYACEMGYLDAVKILVKNGADPEAADTWGNTALMYAVVAGRSAVVEFLVRAFKRLGLQIDRQNKVGNSALEVAKYLGHTECLQALLSNSRRIHDDEDDDDDALAEKLSTVNISEADHEEKPLQIHPTRASPEDGTRPPIILTRKRSLSLRKRIQSMDSIEEYEREGDASLPLSAQGRMFSGVLTPKPPQKLKHGELQTTCSNKHLPPLFYSPRPSKMPSTCAPAASSGPLGILLTPFSKNAKEELEKAKKLPSDVPIRRFDDSYYQKRCSLPTSALTSAAPERLRPLRKSKTVLKTAVNAENAEHASRSLSTLSGRLLRRFTFPEFKRSSKESPEACGAQSGGPEAAGRCIPRSETFPLGNKHPQVGSKPSIDSISAVKCEFDFQFKAAPNV